MEIPKEHEGVIVENIRTRGAFVLYHPRTMSDGDARLALHLIDDVKKRIETQLLQREEASLEMSGVTTPASG